MIKKPDFKLSQHLMNDRFSRYMYIALGIGFGKEIVEKRIVDEKHGEHYEAITDTGVLLVKSADKKTLITLYIARKSQAVRLFDSEKEMPLFLLSIIRDNEKNHRMEKSETYQI